MWRMLAEHLGTIVEGAVLFGMTIYVASVARDLWLTLRRPD